MIHRYWTGTAEPPLGPWVADAIANLHPGTQLHDWTDGSIPPELSQWLDAGQHKVLTDERLRHRANMARWWLIYQHGGIWLDHDVIPLRNLSGLGPAVAAVGSDRSSAIIVAPRGHELARWMLTAIDKYQGAPRTSYRVSGDAVLAGAPFPRLGLIRFPLDAAGQSLHVDDPAAVHLYNTSSTKLNGR